MNRRAGMALSVLFGMLLWSGPAVAQEKDELLPKDEAILVGQNNFGVSLESELTSRDVKAAGTDDRLRVARQSFQFSYGALRNLDLFLILGLGKVTFSEADLSSATRFLWGLGFRTSFSFWGGYYSGLAFQYRAGQASGFDEGDTARSIKDKWKEQDTRLYFGSKDLIRAPEPDLRVYTGVRFSGREDKLSGDRSGKFKEDSSIGVILGADYSDSRIFRFNLELGSIDQNSIQARFGIVF